MLFSTKSFRAGARAPEAVPRVGAGPLFLRKGSTSITPIQPQIESRLASAEPDVEVLLAEVVGGGTLRVFIDHPDGVTLALCERVTMLLNDLRELYTLEVSSPGSRRPLTKPAHFRRFVGRRARVRTRTPRPRTRRGAEPAQVHSFTGELVGASDEDVTIAAGDGVVTIPYERIIRSNLIPGD